MYCMQYVYFYFLCIKYIYSTYTLNLSFTIWLMNQKLYEYIFCQDIFTQNLIKIKNKIQDCNIAQKNWYWD